MAPSIHPAPPASIRLFVESPLADGATIPATAGQAHYLGAVMRRSVGDGVALFNGRDGEWAARIESLRKDRGAFGVTERLRPQPEEPDLWLAFAPLKRDATDLVAQKATELGVTMLRPVTTARTNAGRVNEARLRAIAIEAAEQCERLTVPHVAPLVSLAALLAAWRQDVPLFAAVEREDAPPLAVAAAAAAAGAAGLLIGPEGGFAPEERAVLRRHRFVHPASLGPRILRAETAAIVGLALLQARADG
jgi:16S rRNA (uracil1498-N3)-methyltransferase